MPKLHLGVLHDKPEPEANGTSRVSTYEVGVFMEKDFGLFSHFAADNLQNIDDLLAQDVANAIDKIALGQSFDRRDMFNDSTSKITSQFQKYVNERQLDGYPGVPTKRARQGLYRLKGNKKGPPRTSFIDTGTLFSDLFVWMEGV